MSNGSWASKGIVSLFATGITYALVKDDIAAFMDTQNTETTKDAIAATLSLFGGGVFGGMLGGLISSGYSKKNAEISGKAEVEKRAAAEAQDAFGHTDPVLKKVLSDTSAKCDAIIAKFEKMLEKVEKLSKEVGDFDTKEVEALHKALDAAEAAEKNALAKAATADGVTYTPKTGTIKAKPIKGGAAALRKAGGAESIKTSVENEWQDRVDQLEEIQTRRKNKIAKIDTALDDLKRGINVAGQTATNATGVRR